jgi:DNA-binding YbaB/EbfC family protein
LKDLMGLMKQAQAMQTKMAEAQGELDHIEVEGAAGGGAVKVTLTAKGALKGIAIDDSLLVPGEKEILEDLILAAHDEARKKAERAMEEKMREMAGGLGLPPGMNFPF